MISGACIRQYSTMVAPSFSVSPPPRRRVCLFVCVCIVRCKYLNAFLFPKDKLGITALWRNLLAGRLLLRPRLSSRVRLDFVECSKFCCTDVSSACKGDGRTADLYFWYVNNKFSITRRSHTHESFVSFHWSNIQIKNGDFYGSMNSVTFQTHILY